MNTEYLKTLSSALDKIDGAFAAAAPPPPPAPKWYEGPTAHAELALLADAMDREGYSTEEIIRMLEKPWKWRAEYEYVDAHGGSLKGFDDAAQAVADAAAMDDAGDELEQGRAVQS